MGEITPPPLGVDRLIDDRRIRVIVCCGSGGVGKTTTAAAIGLRAAERGRHVVVLTVDPARRLAQSMGLTSLDNTPRPVPFPDRGDSTPGGSLHAMMLDMKRTFDEIVEAHADPREPVLPVAVVRFLRHPGVHGDGEARAAAPGR